MMKNLLFVFVLVFSLSVKSQTNVYHPFPDSAARWNIDSYQGCGLGFDYWRHQYSIIMSGDTLINSITYHKLTSQTDVVTSNGGCAVTGTWVNPGGYFGAVRQDTITRKVFFVTPVDDPEQLLYDFNLQVNDTVKGYIGSFAYPGDIIQSIDSVFLDGNYRKRLNTNDPVGVSIIEGVGSTFGLIEPLEGGIVDGDYFVVTCFAQNQQTIYPNSSTNCDLINLVKEENHESSSTQVFPNPFFTSGNIRVSPQFVNSELIIFNSFGEEMNREKISGQLTPINRNELSAGIYFFRITNDKGETSSGKFSIQ